MVIETENLTEQEVRTKKHIFNDTKNAILEALFS